MMILFGEYVLKMYITVLQYTFIMTYNGMKLIGGLRVDNAVSCQKGKKGNTSLFQGAQAGLTKSIKSYICFSICSAFVQH